MSNVPPQSPNPPALPVSSAALAAPQPGGNGLGIAGFILAIVSLLAAVSIALFGERALLVALISALAGIILSALGCRSASGRTLAMVGLVISGAVFVVLGLFLLVTTPVSVQRY